LTFLQCGFIRHPLGSNSALKSCLYRSPDSTIPLPNKALALAGPDLPTRHALFDFVVDELHQREPEDPSRIGTMRVALQNQRDDLLAFAGVLDAKLAAIARAAAVPD
jgi:hypothetical protein